MKRNHMKLIGCLLLCLSLLLLTVLPVAATTPEEDQGALLAFWMFYALLCFIVPLLILIWSILRALSRERGYPKYWYILTALCTLWIVLGIALMLVLLL